MPFVKLTPAPPPPPPPPLALLPFPLSPAPPPPPAIINDSAVVFKTPSVITKLASFLKIPDNPPP